MKSMKKQLSICIIIAMLATLLVYPSVFGGGSTAPSGVLATEDFEGETNLLDENCTNETYNGKNAGMIYKKKSVLDIDDVQSGGVKISLDYYAQNKSGANPDCVLIANPATGATPTADCNLVQIFQARVRKTTGDNIYSGNSDPGQWYHLELIINLGSGIVETKVYDANQELLAEGTENVGCNSVGSITFKSGGSLAFYMDNLLVETYDLVAAPTPTPVPTATATPEVTATPETTATPIPVPVPTMLATEDFEGATNALDENCTNQTYNGKNAGEVYKTTSILDIDDVYSGAVKISLDYYAQQQSGANPDCTLIANPASGATSTADCKLVQVFQARIRKTTGDNIYNGNENPGQWYHLEQFINLDSGIVMTHVYDANHVLLAEGTENVGCNSIGSISFKSAGSLAFYMDDVKVETIELSSIPTSTPTPTPTPAPVGSYAAEDFESAVNGFTSNCNNVPFEGVEGKVGEIPYHPSGSGQNTATLNFTDVSEGGIKVSYDLYLTGRQSHYIKANPITGKEYPLLMVNGMSLALTNGGATVYTAPSAGWVHVEQILKLETGVVETKVTSMTGALLLETSNNAGCESIASITLCNWSAASKLNLYIDNLVVENFDVPPQFSKTSFVKTDYVGNEFTGVWGLTPGIASVSVNFGTKMNAATLGGIALKKENGTPVATTGSLSGMVYTLTINEGLEPNSIYQLYIPGTAASSKGILVGSDYTHQFETGEGETVISVSGMTKAGTPITALSQLTAGNSVTVSVGYGNLTASAIPTTLVVAYYSGKTMTKFEAYNLSAPTGFGLLTQTITVPSLTGVDKIQAIALSDLYGMVAYGAPLILQ